MVLKKTGLAAAVLLAGTQLAYANDLNINGFMTVGVGTSDKDVAVDSMDDGANFTNDAILGLQISKPLNSSTSVTGQLVSRGTGDFETEAAWAYITYSADQDTDVRLGRLRTPFFYYSDFLEVGYAYNWTRPPSEVYDRLSPFSSVNGVDLTRRFSMGGADAAVQVYYGNYDGDFSLASDASPTGVIDTDIILKDLAGVVFSTTMGNFGTRVSYHQADVTATGVINLTDGAIAPAFTIDNKTSKFYQAAFTYDNGDISALAEWTQLKHDTQFFTDDMGYMVGIAKRLGETTVHLTYAANEDEPSSKLNQQDTQKYSSIILGTRYDYDSSTALKLEAQHLTNKADENAEEESGMAYTLSVNVVF